MFLLTYIILSKCKFNYNYYKKYKKLLIKNSNESYIYKYNCYKISYKILFVLAILPLSILGAIRYGIGTDYFHIYTPMFYMILNGDGGFTEWGFTYLNKFIQIFTDEAQWLFVVTSFIFVIISLKTILKYSNNILISLVVLFLSGIYFWSFNNIRQTIAASIFLASFPYLVKKDTIKFLIFTFIAFMFHYSSLIFIFVYIFVNFKFIRKHSNIIFLLLIVLIPLFSYLFMGIISKTKYEYFISNSEYNNGSVGRTLVVLNIFYFLISFVILYKDKNKNKFEWVLLSIQFICMFIGILSIFIKISEMMIRLILSFSFYQVLLIPYLFKKARRKYRYLVIGCTLLLLFIYFFKTIIIGGYYEVIPYKSIFSK